MRSKTIFRQPLYLPYSDTAPLAGIFFALTCLFLFVYSPKGPRQGLVLVEETPQQCYQCFNVPSASSLTICLTADGRTSFAASDISLQTAVLKRISGQYGVYFSTAYINRLKALPFLAVKLEQLPSILAISAPGAMSLSQLSSYSTLTDRQLLGCVQAARELAPTYTQSSADIFLLVDARTDASKVMHLLHIFQNQGITRFNLVVHCLY